MDPALINDGAETRAAVALLTRSIRILSAGDTAGETFEAASKVAANCQNGAAVPNCYSFGANTVFRQGFKQVQIQGVEFVNMGQGGKMGHYPLHFHEARHVPTDTFVKDSSINESMTRWIVLHSTQGVLFQRNIGYKSIGSGFFLENGTEVDNKFYSNLGIFARAAVNNPQNPRKIPGILAADASDSANGTPFLPQNSDPFPFATDYPASHGVLDQQRLERLHRQYGGGRGGLRRRLLVRLDPEQRHARRADLDQPVVRHGDEVDGLSPRCRTPRPRPARRR